MKQSRQDKRPKAPRSKYAKLVAARRPPLGPTGRNILSYHDWTPERLELFVGLRELAEKDLDAARRLFAETT